MDKNLSEQFIKDYKASGKKMDVGKSCVRFKSTDQLPFELIGKAVSVYTADEFIVKYQESRK